MSLQGPIRIAVDIGGTFTDIQVLHEPSARTFAFKTPTTPDDPSRGLMEGVRGAARRHGFELGQVGVLMHGTTIATNAVLEHKLPPGALVTTAGFRDVLEIGRHLRQRIYSAIAEPRRLLIERSRRFEVSERVDADGRVCVPLDEAELHGIAQRIEASGARTVAVCLLHAYANPEHERMVGRFLREHLGHGFVSLSHELSPEIREFERSSTVAINALLMPVVKSYLDALRARMQAEGFAPRLYLVQSNGGVTSPQLAAEQPARLLLSGPSGGARAAQVLGEALAEPDLVAVDMGGTSFDVSLIHDGRMRLVSEGAVDGCPVRLPMIEIRTIGAGGGSIATVEPNLRFRVGPESAGASPGPAAYAAGGVRPTVTDANLVLNRIDPEYFLGGGMRLDAVAAREAVRRELARPLELTVQAAAEGVLKVAVANMAAAIRLSLYEKGLDPKDFALISFGGAGGLHAVEVAAELGARRVIFPTEASTLSAWGMLFSDVVLDRARSRPLTADADAVAPLAELAEALIAEASAELEQAGFAAERRRLLLSADMRYPGQAYEVMVPLEGIDVNAARIDAAVARFHDLHERAYAHAERRTTPEIVTLRLSAVGELGKPRLVERAASDDTPCKARRSVYLDGCEQTLPVYERDAIGGGVRLAGPLLVEDEYTTLFLPGGWGLARLGGGELVAERDEVDP